MNFASWLLWGFVATVLLTTLLSASQGLRMTRMDFPYLLGSLVTLDRDRARVVGALIHLINGWIFALVYVAIFHERHFASWWLGALIGFGHAAFLLIVVLPILPGLHPRMASSARGPTIARQIEPPGFLGLHYGWGTPVSIVVAHLVFGALLGELYQLR